MRKREPGLDLLRCLALLFVVTFHSFLNNGYYTQPQRGAAMWLAGSFRWLCVSCIGLFLMLTGYLKSGRTDFRSCWRGLAPVLLGYLLAAAVSIPIRHFVFGDTHSLSGWITKLLGFSAVYYGWYVEMYAGLVLMMPFVNMLLCQLKDGKHLLVFVCVMLTLTALPGATPLNFLPDHWRNLYPLTYYILGAVVRRVQPRVTPWMGIGTAVVMALALGGATVLSTDGNLGNALTWEFADLWIAVMAVCLFVSLYRVETGPVLEIILSFGANGCYGGYLLSHLLDAWCYKLVPQWRTPARYPKLFLFVTVPIFLVSVLGGRVLQKLTRGLLSLRRGASGC